MTDAVQRVAVPDVAKLKRNARIALGVGIGGFVLRLLVSGGDDDVVPDSAALLVVLGWGALLVYLLLQHRLRRALAKLETASDTPAPPETLSWKSLTGVIIIAVVLVVIREPLLISLLGILFFVGVLGAALEFRKRRATAIAHLVKGAIYGIGAVVASVAMTTDRNNAELMPRILEEYKHRHGSYPEKLDALVPELMPQITRPGLIGFQYSRQGEGYLLSYRPSVAGPCSYLLEKSAWNCKSD